MENPAEQVAEQPQTPTPEQEVSAAPAQQETPPVYTEAEFLSEYEALCTKMGYIFTIEPKFKFNEDGSYGPALIVESKIAKKV